MISKDLLREVLGEEYNDRLVDWFQIEDNYLRTYYDCGRYDYEGRPTGLGIEINIHELSDMCKQRITSKFPMFSIKWHPNYVKGTPPACVKVWVQGELLGNQPTEPEAVFQAYQELLTKGLL